MPQPCNRCLTRYGSSVHEAAEMVQLANALVLNFGTIRDETFQAMLLAGEAANALSIPIILDPVGVGATTFRTNKVFELLKKVQVQIIRGTLVGRHDYW